MPTVHPSHLMQMLAYPYQLKFAFYSYLLHVCLPSLLRPEGPWTAHSFRLASPSPPVAVTVARSSCAFRDLMTRGVWDGAFKSIPARSCSSRCRPSGPHSPGPPAPWLPGVAGSDPLVLPSASTRMKLITGLEQGPRPPRVVPCMLPFRGGGSGPVAGTSIRLHKERPLTLWCL